MPVLSIWDRDPTTELAAIRKRIRSGYHGTGGKGLAKRDLWYAMNLIDRGLVPVQKAEGGISFVESKPDADLAAAPAGDPRKSEDATEPGPHSARG